MTSTVTGARYQPNVRIGNWFEDICLQQEKVRNFKISRDTGHLLVEKTRALFEAFHKEIELEAPKETICFGAIVQLMPLHMKICDLAEDVHPALSVVINETVVRHSQRINDECEFTIAPSSKPCVRSSFRIIGSDDRDRTNEVLKYGQQFRLECVDTMDDHLMIYTVPKANDLSSMINYTFESRKRGEVNLPLGLCDKKNCGPGKPIPAAYMNWFCQHIDPKLRFETNNTPLPSNKPLVITHVATNRNLSAEPTIIQTLFGPEYLASVQIHKDIYKREHWQNVWMICNGHQFK